MDFNLTDDQRAFADSAQALFADYCADDALRQFDVSGKPFMQSLWAQCVESGLHTILVPEDEGGLGLGLTDLLPVLEQQGRALALVPLWETQLGTALLARFGSAALREQAVAPLVGGEALLAVSLAGAAASRGPGLQLARDDEGWRLDGFAAAVPLAEQSRWALLPAEHDGAWRLVLVEPDAGGVSRAAGTSQHHLAVADLKFDNVALRDDAVLAEGAFEWFEPRALACLAALQLGVTSGQLARTVEYVSERRQFERAIGSFQLVAGQMADGHIALETLRSTLWQLVFRLDAGLEAQPQALGVRVQACEMAQRTGHMAQHVHGGMGVDVTFHIHRYLFWSRALSNATGNSEYTLARLGGWLAANNNLGWKYDLEENHTDAKATTS